MTKRMTLNQVIQALRNIVSRHRQVSTFYFGELGEWVSFSGLTYPSVLLVLNDAELSAQEAQYNFSIYIADLLNQGGDNRTEIHSDTLSILQDFYSSAGDDRLDFQLVKPSNSVTFFDDQRNSEGENPDNVAGVKSEFSIRAEFIRDWCAVPSRKAIITEQGFDIFTEDGQQIIAE